MQKYASLIFLLQVVAIMISSVYIFFFSIKIFEKHPPEAHLRDLCRGGKICKMRAIIFGFIYLISGGLP